MSPVEVTEFIRLSSTFVTLAAVALAPFAGPRRMLLIQLALFPLANVYLAGMAFAVTTAILFGEVFWKSRSLHIPWFYVSLWTGWLVLNLGRSAIEGGGRELYQLAEFAFYGVLLMLLIPLLSVSWEFGSRIQHAASAAAVLLAIVVILSGGVEAPVMARVIGPNEGSFILVMFGVLVPLQLAMRMERKFYPIMIIIISVIAIRSLESRAAIAVSLILISMSALFLMVGKRIFLATIIALVFVSALTGGVLVSFKEQIEWRLTHPGYSDLERLNLIRASLRLYEEHLFLGWGWGSGDALFPEVPETDRIYPHPHNTYAQFAVEMGTVGLLFLALLFGRLLYLAIKAGARGYRSEAVVPFLTFVALSMFSMVEVIFYGANRAIVAIVVIGVAEGLVNCASRSTTSDGSAAF